MILLESYKTYKNMAGLSQSTQLYITQAFKVADAYKQQNISVR